MYDYHQKHLISLDNVDAVLKFALEWNLQFNPMVYSPIAQWLFDGIKTFKFCIFAAGIDCVE